MPPSPRRSTEELIAAARLGDGAAWADLLERYRPYLTVLAARFLERRLRVKVEPADVVQEVFLRAHRGFPAFRGAAGGEFSSWLRTILNTQFSRLARRYFGTGMRNLDLEQPLVGDPDPSSGASGAAPTAPGSTPGTRAQKREEAVRVAAALERLDPDHRTVVRLRHFEELSFPEVGARMDRSEDAVRKLWTRAVRHLEELLGGPDVHPPAGP